MLDVRFGHVPDDWRISAGYYEKGRQAQQCVEWLEALQKRSVFYQRVYVANECGHPGNMPVDVVSKSFPDVVKVVQKLESTVFVISPTVCRVNEFADLATIELLSVPRLCHRHETVHVLHGSSCRVKQVILMACTFAQRFTLFDPARTHTPRTPQSRRTSTVTSLIGQTDRNSQLGYMRDVIELLRLPPTCERAAACEAFHWA